MPGGWHFMATPTLRIDAETFPELITTLERYRISNNLPIGDPLADIESYICTTFPHSCHSVMGATVTAVVDVGTVNPRRNLLDRIILWFELQMSKLGTDVIVLQGEAERRAQICMRCPENKEWKTGCGECTSNIDRLSKLVRSGHALARDRKLKACSVLGQENRAAVWLKRDRLSSADNLPGHCWLRS